MSEEEADEGRVTAADLIRAAAARLRKQEEDERTRELVRVSAEHVRSGRPPVDLPEERVESVADALEEAVRQAALDEATPSANAVTRDEDRLSKVEMQTQALTHAVITMTESAEAIGAAVRAAIDAGSAPETPAEPVVAPQ